MSPSPPTSSRSAPSGGDPLGVYVQNVTDAQPRLYSFIMTLVGDLDAAKDVLQQTNLVLWEKRDDYDPTRPFDAWAFGVARIEALTHTRDHARDRLVFSESALNALADEAVEDSAVLDARRAALRRCMGKLTDHQRQLITARYASGANVQNMADDLGRPVGSVSVALTRIRKSLAKCIRTHMQSEGNE